jgi:outer membrane protein OmpA-like peptidoglycan-associated protein
MRSTVNFLISFFIAFLISCSMHAQKQYDTLVLHFPFNGFILRQEDSGRLSNFLQVHTLETDSLYIFGFTDTVGAVAYNMRLSLSRAQSTARCVKRFTSIPFRIFAKGEEDPIAGDDSLSRRVLIITSHFPRTTEQGQVVGIGQQSSIPALRSSFDTMTPTVQQPDTIISLANVNFIEDTPNLTAASRMALPAYIQFLRRFKAEFLEIDGYCNSTTPITSTTDPLYILSVKRAKLFFDFLVDDGFDSTRLSYKGMGNAFPKNSNPANNDEARANMRVEVRIYRKAPGK